MPVDEKIRDLVPLIQAAPADLFPIVDDDQPAANTKNITKLNLMGKPGPIGGLVPSTGEFTTLQLQIGTDINEFSTDGTLVGDSDDALPTEKAVKTYVDNAITGVDEHNELLGLQGGDSTNEYYHLTLSDYNSIVNQDFVLRDGSLPLTGDWDAGNYQITIQDLFVDGTATITTLINLGGGTVSLTESSGDLVVSGGTITNDLTLASGPTINAISIDGTLSGDSTSTLVTESAVKAYVGSATGGFTPTYMFYADGSGNITETADMNYDSASGIIDLGGYNTGNPYIWIEPGSGVYMKNSADDTGIFIDDSDTLMQFSADSQLKMYIDENGVHFGGADIDEILESSDSISGASTDSQLATAKLIYNYTDGAFLKKSGFTPTYMFYADGSGNITETADMNYDSASGITLGTAANSYLFLDKSNKEIQATINSDIVMQIEEVNAGVGGSQGYIWFGPTDNQLFWTTDGDANEQNFSIDVNGSRKFGVTEDAGQNYTEIRSDSAQLGLRLHHTDDPTYSGQFRFLTIGPIVPFTVSSSGIKLLNSTIYVNDILNTTDGDSITGSSTDSQLATAKLIYDYTQTLDATSINVSCTEGIYFGGDQFLWTPAPAGSGCDWENISMGYGVGSANDAGSYNNTVIGAFAGRDMTTGFRWNVIIGSYAGQDLTSDCDYNTLIGDEAGIHLTSNCDDNVYIGGASGRNNTAGNMNTALGFYSGGRGGVQGDYNVSIGPYAGYWVTGNRNVFLGYRAGRQASSQSFDDRLYIANSETSTPLIYGEFDNDLVRINGDLEVTNNLTVDATATIDVLKVSSGTEINEFSIDGTLAGNSDDAVPTEKAVKTYVDTQIGLGIETGNTGMSTGDTTAEIVFVQQQGSEQYSIGYSIINTVDNPPLLFVSGIFEKSVTGFKIMLSSPVDTDNYYISWVVGDAQLGSSSSSSSRSSSSSSKSSSSISISSSSSSISSSSSSTSSISISSSSSSTSSTSEVAWLGAGWPHPPDEIEVVIGGRWNFANVNFVEDEVIRLIRNLPVGSSLVQYSEDGTNVGNDSTNRIGIRLYKGGGSISVSAVVAPTVTGNDLVTGVGFFSYTNYPYPFRSAFLNSFTFTSYANTDYMDVTATTGITPPVAWNGDVWKAMTFINN